MLAPWIVTPDVAEMLGAVAPLDSCANWMRLAVRIVCGSWILNCRFCVESLFETTTLNPPLAIFIAYAVAFREPALIVVEYSVPDPASVKNYIP
jgi:hypothetical protein